MADVDETVAAPEETEEQPRPVINRTSGASPLIPSAPSDATDLVPKPGPVPPKVPILPGTPNVVRQAIQQQNYKGALDRFNARTMYDAQQARLKSQNIADKEVLARSNIATETDPQTGFVRPKPLVPPEPSQTEEPRITPLVADSRFGGYLPPPNVSETKTLGRMGIQMEPDPLNPGNMRPVPGQVEYKEGKGPIRFEQATGRPVQTVYSKTGPKEIEPPEVSQDLHSTGTDMLSRAIYENANNLRGMMGAQKQLQTLQAQADDLQEAAKKTEGGFLGMGAKPTSEALAAQHQLQLLKPQIDELSKQVDPQAIQTARDAHKDLTNDLAVWRKAKPQSLDDLNAVVASRMESLIEAGKDPDADPVLSAIEVRKRELGMPAAAPSAPTPIGEQSNLSVANPPAAASAVREQISAAPNRPIHDIVQNVKGFFYPLFGPNEQQQQRLYNSIIKDRIAEKGLVPSLSEYLSEAASIPNFVREIALVSQGKSVTPESLAEYKDSERRAVGLGVNKGDSKGWSVTKGLANGLLNAAEAIANPAFLSVPSGRAVSGFFSYQMLSQLPDAIGRIRSAPTLQGKVEASIDAATDLLAGGYAAKHAMDASAVGHASRVAFNAAPETAELVRDAVKTAKKNGVSPEFRAFFGGIDPEIAGTTPAKVKKFAEDLGMKWTPQPKPEAAPATPQREAAPKPDIGAAHEEINNLQMVGKTPEEHAATQTTLRALTKIATGSPMETLTAEEKRSVLQKGPDGLPKVEIVKGVPVITNGTLQRVRQIAPITAQLLPETEENQRATILAGQGEAKAPVKAPAGESKPATTSTEALPTFAVEVQNAKGETTTKEIQASSEGEAKSQVAKSIKPGEGLVRDVSQITEAPAPRVEPKDFINHALERAYLNKGSDLTPEETKAATTVARVLKPHYERWSKAFDQVNTFLGSKATAGLAFTKGRQLQISVRDVINHARFYRDTPQHAGNLMLHEAAHSVTTAVAPQEIARLWKEAPKSLRDAMKKFYKADDSDYALSHEYWAYFLAGRAELAAGRRIRLAGKFLPEQASRQFVVENRRALARVLRFVRDSEKELRRSGASAEFIGQWKKLENLFVAKMEEVDSHAKTESKEVTHEGASTGKAPAEPTARGPPVSAKGRGQPEQKGGSSAGGNIGTARVTGRSNLPGATEQETAGRTPPASTRTKLGEGPPAAAAERLPGGALERRLPSEDRASLALTLKIPEGAVGNQSQITQNGRTLNVAYIAQEAADARPSHDIQGRENPLYDQSLQPRERSLPSYRKQAQNIANNLDFKEALFFPGTNTPATTTDIGPPIMLKHGDTLIGNGREIGIKAAYDQNLRSAAKYKTDFIRAARGLGINPATVRDMAQPILKRVILDDLPKDDLIRFSQESNAPTAMPTNAIEVAGQDASRINPQLLSLFDPNYSLEAAKNQSFLKAFVRDVVRGQSANEANLTPSELARRVRAAVFTYAYGADETGRAALERLAGDETDGGKTITNGLLTVAPIMARLRVDVQTGDLQPGMDITPAISRAAQEISKALLDRPKNQVAKVALDSLLSQGELFAADLLERAALKFLIDNRGKRTAIEEGLSNYAEAVYRLGNPREGELFGAREIPTPLALFTKSTSDEGIERKEAHHTLAAQRLDGYLRQSFKSQDDAFASANRAKPAFDRELNEIARLTGTEAITAPVKSAERAAAKVAIDYSGDWSQIRDLVRGTIITKDLEHANKVVATLRQRFGIEPKRTFKDALSTGYRDALFNPVIDGHATEIQVHLEPVVHAKERAHKFYERQQEIARRAKTANRPLNAQELRTVERLTLAQRRIYDSAFGNIEAGISSTASEGLQGRAPSDLISSGVTGRGITPSVSKDQAVPSLSTTIAKGPLAPSASKKEVAPGNLAAASSSVIPRAYTQGEQMRAMEILRSQPISSPDDGERIQWAAVRLPDGSIYHALAHYAAVEDALSEKTPPEVRGYEDGFLTSRGSFLSREQAATLFFGRPSKFSLDSADLNWEDRALGSQQFQLFDDFASTLPAKAKVSKPVLRETVKKELPQLSDQEQALEDLFALANHESVSIGQSDGRNLGTTREGAATEAKELAPTPRGGGKTGEAELPAGERAGVEARQPREPRGGGRRREAAGGGGADVGEIERPGEEGVARPDEENLQPVPSGKPGGLVEPPRQLVDRPLPEDPREQNFVIPRGERIAPAGTTAKFKANLDAIALLERLGDALPTPEEKSVLVKYTGWGWAGEYFNENKPAFASQREQIKKALSDEDYRSARASTINAHFTAPQIISSMWDMVRRLGFEGGAVLEPAGGVGHFFGLMPQDIARKSNLRGVELDNVSGRIFQKLYPESEIQVTGFQEAKIPNNSIDLAISNVPFGDYKVPGGRDYPNLFIHDYFFARSLDKVRPGGLVAFITSDGTLDKADKRVRELLASKADLVGAVRLPNTAFLENAGTEVTTDIILFRKKDNSNFIGEPFTRLTTVGRANIKDSSGKLEGRDIRVNEYYAHHPEQALGEHTLAGTMYGGGDYALVAKAGQDTERLLNQAGARLPEKVMGERLAEIPESLGDLAQQGQREYSTQLAPDGNFMQVVDGRLEPAKWLTEKGFSKDWETTISPQERVKRERIATDWLKLREATTKLIASENNPRFDDADLRLYRAQLNKAYENFRIKHGTLNKRPGQQHNEKARFLLDDPDYPLLQALESEVRKIDPRNNKVTYEYRKADIFSKRIRTPKSMPVSAKDPSEAVAISLGYTGKVDPTTIAKLLSISVEEAKNKIVESGRAFENPESGKFETRERYLSGNVRKKLKAAEAAAENDPKYQVNADALRAALPERIPLSGIYYNLGSRWMSTEVYAKFASELLGSPTTVTYLDGMNRFIIRPQNTQSVENTTTWSTKDFRGADLLTHGLNLTEPEVKINIGTSSQPKYVRDDKATEAARAQLRKIRAQFQSWVKTTTATVGEGQSLQEHVEDHYNEANNAMVAPHYSGDYLSLPGLSDTVHRLPHRLSVVARILQEGAAMMAHGVGSGKTFSQIVAAMEMRRLGLAKKPVIVVQKSTIGQFAASFRDAYPDARVLVANEKSFEKVNRRRFMGRIATRDYDAVILTQPQFDRLPNKEETIRDYFQEKIDALEVASRSAAEELGARDPTTKQIEKAKMRLEEKMQKKIDALKSRQDFLPFEDLGVDALFVDEAHAYKKAPITTNMRNVRGVPNDESQRAMGLEMKARKIQDANNGRNVILATGTPITNTMAEAYVMLRLATPKVLDEYGIKNFDDFASLFGQTTTKLEYSWGGTWKLATRFNKFVNGAELVTMIRSGFDVKMGNKELGLKVPKQKGENGADRPKLIIVPQTPAMKNISDWILQIADKYEKLPGGEKRDYSYIPIVTMQAGMAGALDPRLIDTALPDEPGSKVNTAIAEILRIHKETGNDRLTQAVFADRFKPINVQKLRDFIGGVETGIELDESEPDVSDSAESEEAKESELSALETNEYASGGFNLYHDIRAKLIRGGVPADEIAIIHDFNTDKKKAKLFDDVNDGRVRIVLGSTEKLGIGVNMQTRLVALHHLDPPRMMTPAMVEQRDGRGIRQGNTNAEIWNNRYGTEQSMDTGIYQMLENKDRFIKQALSGKGVGRAFEDAADEATRSMAEMKALLTGDERVLRKSELEQELAQLEVEKGAFEDEQSNRARKLARARQEESFAVQREIPRVKADVEFIQKNFNPENLTAEIQGNQITDRKEIAPVIDRLIRSTGLTAAKQGKYGQANSSVFSVGGVPMMINARASYDAKDVSYTLGIFSPTQPGENLRLTQLNNGLGAVQSVSAFARNYPKRIEEIEAERAHREKQITELERGMGETWSQQKVYDDKRAELNRIELSLLGKEEKADASEITSTTGVGVRSEGEEVGEETPLRQPGETAEVREEVGSGQLAAQPIAAEQERFNEGMPLAMKIASRFGNIRGAEPGDVQSRAQTALLRAVRSFDPNRGAFLPFARTAINNDLRRFYRERNRGPVTESLEEPIGETGLTALDTLAARDDTVQDVFRGEGGRILSEVISELPDRMGKAINAILEGESLESVGQEIGISRQAVSRLAVEGMRRLRGKLGERGIASASDLLSQVIDDELKSQETENPIEHLMSILKDDPMEKLRAIPGLDHPDLALGMEPGIRAAHEFHRKTQTPQTVEQWDKRADEILAERGNNWADDVIARWTSGSVLEPAEVRATQKWLIERQQQSMTDAERRQYDTAAYAYTKIGEATARALASRVDPFQTPEERNREFMAKALVRLTKRQERDLAAIASNQTRVEQLEAMIEARRKAINAALEIVAGKGVTIDDILSGQSELRLKGAKIIENQLGDYSDKEQKAIRLAQTGARSASDIAKAVGLSEKTVKDLNDRFISDLEEKLMAKTRAGATLENLDPETLLAQPAEGELGSQPVSEDVARAEARKMIRAMGFVASKDLGRFKVKKQKRKLFVPPPPSGKPVEAPAPGDLPYPEPAEAPYTGRVLGQPGLPLYQEMMIRKGADMGSADDVARLGRIISAAANGNRFDMLYEAWLANILSGPTTHLSYKLALGMNMGLEFSIQRGVESLVNLAVRDPKSAQLGEFKYLIRGLIPGFTRGLGLGVRQFGAEAELLRDDVLNQQVEAFKGPGRTMFAPAISERPFSQLLNLGERTTAAQKVTQLGESIDNLLGRLGRYNPARGRVIRMPHRVLYFVQGFYAGIGAQMNVAAFAYRQAKAEGLKGDALSNRINELVATPNSDPWQRAVEQSEVLTFRQRIKTKEKGGNFLENAVAQFIRARSGSHLLGSQMPFIELPYNLVRTGIRKTPFGAANLLWRTLEGGFFKMKDGKPFFESYPRAEFVRHIAEQVIAWATAALLWNLTWGDDDDDQKLIVATGGMPTSTDQADMRKSVRELYERAYGGPTQIVIGGRNGVHIPYGKFEPIATVLGTVVNTLHQLKHLVKGEQNIPQTLAGIWSYTVAQAEEKTFLRGLARIMDAIRHPDQAGGEMKRLLFEALVPNLIRQPLRNLDDYIRRSREAPAAYSSFPAGGLAEPRINVYGQPVTKQGNWFTRQFFVAGVKPDAELQKADALLLNWNRHHPQNAYAPSVPKTSYIGHDGKDTQMTPEQATRFTEAVGRRFTLDLRGRINQHMIEHPSEDDIKTIKSIHTKALEDVKTQMFPKPLARPKTTTNVVRNWLQPA